MAERFYTNSDLGLGQIILEGPEAHHLSTVSRNRPGEVVYLFNGDGRQYQARIAEVSRRTATLEVEAVETPNRELGFPLLVAAPVPRGDRAQFLLEKLTELGATDFFPLETARSVVHPREAKLDKLGRYVIEASKQCGRNILLRVHPMVSWQAFGARSSLPSCKLLAHPNNPPWEGSPDAQGMALAVGPEGGFTDEEVELGCAAGWQVTGLGPRILRVETAALALVLRCTLP